MLKTLHILNYAIIDEVDIVFDGKLNVITGETGAGKSILMGALSLILGDRADTSVLLNREKKCIVEGLFTIDNKQALRLLLKDYDLEHDQQEILIRREIAVSGKSRAFVNDTPVNLEQLRQVSLMLVDLHRQFDTLSLADAGFQREVIDALAGNAEMQQQYGAVYRQWRSANQELNSLQLQKSSFDKEYDYNKFLFDELEEAAFLDNELETADEELKLLTNAESIKNALEATVKELTEGERPVVQQIKYLQSHLNTISKYHIGVEELLKRLHSVQLELQDIAGEAGNIGDRVQYDGARIDLINERISIGYKLLKKHGVQTTGDLIAIRDKLAARLREVMDIDETILQKEKAVASLLKQTNELAAQLSGKRGSMLKPLEEKVNRLLTQVGMPNARIKATMHDREIDISGKDQVEFLFDANKSGRFEPIRKVASGGELSRLMLSIKSLVAESMDLPTLIFDEIDSGISGEAAKQVGRIMSELAAKRQLITITHQPQIAGKANSHLFVYKKAKGDSVNANIRLLSNEERIMAIAQMLSGEKPTAAALANAREMVMN